MRDPIFKRIAEHKRISTETDRDTYLDATNRLLRTAPTTLGGVLSLLNYVIREQDAADNGYHWVGHGVAYPGPFLRSLRKGIKTALADIEAEEL
jgi:hypothetical protein